MQKIILALLWVFLGVQGNGLAFAEGTIFQSYVKPLPAPDFCLEDLRQKWIDIKEYRGQVILLNFWATW